MFIMALVLWRCLPRYKQHTGLNYGQLLGSIFALFIHTPRTAYPRFTRGIIIRQFQCAMDINGLPAGRATIRLL